MSDRGDTQPRGGRCTCRTSAEWCDALDHGAPARGGWSVVRYVPFSQVWEGSRGRARNVVHLNAPAGFEAGRLKRPKGGPLCGAPVGYYVGDSVIGWPACPQCAAVAKRHGVTWPATFDETGRVVAVEVAHVACSERAAAGRRGPSPSGVGRLAGVDPAEVSLDVHRKVMDAQAVIESALKLVRASSTDTLPLEQPSRGPAIPDTPTVRRFPRADEILDVARSFGRAGVDVDDLRDALLRRYGAAPAWHELDSLLEREGWESREVGR